jgi:hypothetical protein
MAEGKLRILHPSPKKVETVKGPNFAAFGKAEGAVGTIKGVVTAPDGTTYDGTTLEGGPDWVISFEEVPKGTDYVLEVRAAFASPVNAKFDVKDVYQIGILYPRSTDCPLCTTFTAYGSSDLANPVSGQMSHPTLGVYFGTTLQGPPDSSSWYIKFQGVAESPGDPRYTLTVTDTEGLGDSSQGLTVDHRACS